VTLIWVAVSVDHRDLNAVGQTNRVDAHLAIFETIVGSLDSESVEDPRGVPKSDPMPADIGGVFHRIPREPHP
jgi:hypothetical protein